MKFSPAFEETGKILGQTPLPDDAYERLEKLEKQIYPSERDKFGDVWEAFIAADGKFPPESE